MRNAGEGTPSGGAGRRHRAAAPTVTPRSAGNGGASLFTPAYRVRHAAAIPSSAAQDGIGMAAPRGVDADYDLAADGQAGTGYSWSADDEPALGYRQASYGDAENAWADSDLPVSGYRPMTDDPADGIDWPSGGSGGLHAVARTLSNAIRGFAPLPDEPLPVYPPGPFAAWNRSSTNRGDVGFAAAAGELTTGELTTGELGTSARSGSAHSLAIATITPDEFDTDYSLPAIKDPVPDAAASGSRATVAGRPATGRSSTESGARAGHAAPARSATSRSAASSGSRTATRGGPTASRSQGRSKSKRSGSKHQSVWLAIGTAAIIVAAVIVVLVMTSLGSTPATPAKTASPPRTPQATPTAPPGKWAYIGSRATDPIPLTLAELYPARFITGGAYYHVTIMNMGHGCGSALIGGSLQAAVRQAGCSQVLRATYISHTEQAMATIGVFNLTDSTAASSAALHAGRSQFVAQ